MYSPVGVDVERRLVGLVRVRGVRGVRGVRRRRGRVRRRHVAALGAAPLRADLLFAPPLRATIREPHLNVGLG